MKVAIILGTRPQIIKSAPVYAALVRAGIECPIINTGQHYDYMMNKEFFKELQLPDPAADLEIGSGTPNEQIARILQGLEGYLTRQRPDIVIVPGDTNSALAGGVASSKMGIRLAHLESGCRSDDFTMSEEINRRVLDQISQVLLCPTELCVENLHAEHVLAQIIRNVGDTMYDSMQKCMPSIDASRIMNNYDVEAGSYVFMTLHRAENVDKPDTLQSILRGVGSFACPVIFCVHPRTRARIAHFNTEMPTNVIPIDPLPYFDTLKLVKESGFVVTDSGGLQKEAFWLKRPALIARENTEWIEIVQAGAATLVGADASRILKGYNDMSERMKAKDIFEGSLGLFGDGRASEKVVETIIEDSRWA